MLIKSTDALIHFDYTRYFHYYRIRKLLRNHLFYLCSNLCECFEFVGKRIGLLGLDRAFKDIFIVMEITVPARAKVSLPTELQRASC